MIDDWPLRAFSIDRLIQLSLKNDRAESLTQREIRWLIDHLKNMDKECEELKRAIINMAKGKNNV